MWDLNPPSQLARVEKVQECHFVASLEGWVRSEPSTSVFRARSMLLGSDRHVKSEPSKTLGLPFFDGRSDSIPHTAEQIVECK